MNTQAQAGASFDEILDTGKFSFTQVRVISISLLLMILDGFDITSMAFVAHRVGEELAITPSNLGVVFSVTLAGMMFGAMFLAPYSDKFGRRFMLLFSVASIGITMLLTGFVQSLWQLAVLRCLTGIGVGIMLANLTALTTEYAPTKYRSFSVAIIAAGFPLGATLGGIIVAPLLPYWGWQGVFFLLGVVSLLMVFVVFWFVPESLQFLHTIGTQKALKQSNTILAKMGRGLLVEFPPIKVQAARKASVTSLLMPQWRFKTLELWATFFFVFVSLYFLMSWLPKLVVNAGLGEQKGVFSAVALNGGGVIGTLLLGWIASHIRLTTLISLFLVLSAFIMLTFGLVFGHINLYLLLFVLGFFLQGGFVGLYSASAKLYPTEIRATGIGWALGLGRIGAVVGPYVGGLLVANNVTMSFNFMLFAIPLCVASVLAYRLKIG